MTTTEVSTVDVENIEDEVVEKEHFLTKNGEIPLWDHPELTKRIGPPFNYKPVINIPGALHLVRNGILDKQDITILKVIADAICSTDDQLKRVLELANISRSYYSKQLKMFRTLGLADRWVVRIDEDDEVKPSAPITLGTGGYLLLSQLYGATFLVKPESFHMSDISFMLRFIALNEFRVVFAERKVLRSWKWQPRLYKNSKYEKPQAVAEVITANGNITFLLERAQQQHDFISHLQKKLESWKVGFEKHGEIRVDGIPQQTTVVVIHASTLSIAHHIHNTLMLDTFPFPIWVAVEEEQENFNTSFFVPQGEKLNRIRLDIF